MSETLTLTPAQVVTKLDKALATLDEKRNLLTTRLAEAKRELDLLVTSENDLATAISQAHAHLDLTDKCHSQMVRAAVFALETPDERRTTQFVSSAKKDLQSAQKRLEKAEREYSQAQTNNGKRRVELDTLLVSLQSELDQIDSEHAKIQAERDRAHSDAGQHMHAALLRDFLTKQRELDELRAKVVDANVVLLDTHANTLEQLREWPDEQREMQARMPKEDATSRLMAATLAYIDISLRDHKEARHETLHLESLKRPMYGPRPLLETLLIPDGAILNLYRLPFQTSMLEAHREWLAQVYQEYQAWLQEQEVSE